MASEDMMDRTINAIITQMVAVILLAQAFLPTAINQIDTLGDKKYEAYVPLLEVIVTITIVSILIGIVKFYVSSNRGGR